ncbi:MULTISPECIES: cation:dicarboxylate symporter family transporter [Cytobacillus]|uniref:cation:dicarboxylate symporter family transporter n=1 Tax=Cytobacillus TaxID=2675230 RepID=UPI001CD35EAA|nr:cation:dicarboxylase symporter family transporter [Cytobacillus kochii]MCA1028075.1 cation:dicarboxylase symporter family transporter [Cytobacillus kochii]MCM3323986.1 cation:dicarboxylase symporter family transporter [Cytobacillus kochii]MCM3346382.1 cation:dicarboxylase symporter family transporter [Cytobacillus kochii]MDM5205744.1 cation:dicarboxylase symporter family transporter [Cytobacillus kochii]
MKKIFKMSLATQILIGLILGIVIGGIFYGNETAQSFLQPFGDLFIRLIKMIVVPIVLSTIIVAIAGVGDIKSVGKLGGKSLFYFIGMTMVAIAVGLISANIFQPGAGLDMESLEQNDISGYVQTNEEQEGKSIADTLLHIVPTNPVQAMVEGDMLAIIFFAVVFGLGVAAIGEKGKPVLRFFEGTAKAMFYVTNLFMKYAPIGVFALIGVTISKYGFASLIPLGKLALTVYGTMAFFVIVILGIMAKIIGVNIFKLLGSIKEELLLAFSTASSETVLPRIMDKMEQAGSPKHIASFVIPTGYSFNLDGSVLYQAIAALFIAQMFGIELSIVEQITLMLVLMITSKGMAGVPGVSFVVLLATFSTIGLPAAGLAFIAGIDRILDMGRTAVNVVGNSLAALVIAKWEGQFNPPADNKVQKAS